MVTVCLYILSIIYCLFLLFNNCVFIARGMRESCSVADWMSEGHGNFTVWLLLTEYTELNFSASNPYKYLILVMFFSLLTFY